MDNRQPEATHDTAHDGFKGSGLPRKFVPALSVLVIFVIAFLIGAYIVVPAMIGDAVRDWANAAPGRMSQVESVSVEPFSLTVQLVKPKFSDARTGIVLSARRIELDFDIRSLLGRHWAFDRVWADALHVRFASSDSRPDQSVTGLFRRLMTALRSGQSVRLNHLRITHGRLRFGDRGDNGRALAFDHITATAAGLSTMLSTPGHYQVEARVAGLAAQHATRLELAGTMSLRTLEMDGQASVTSVELSTLAPWFGERLVQLAPRGSMDFGVHYHYAAGTEAGQPGQWQLTTGHGTLDNLSVQLAPGLPVRVTHAEVGKLKANGSGTDWTFEGRMVLQDGGLMVWSAGAGPIGSHGHRARIVLTGFSKAAVAKFASWSLGHRLTAGQAELDLEYTVKNQLLKGHFRIHGHNLAFASASPKASLSDDSLRLALALLQDPSGDIEFRAPISVRFGHPVFGANAAAAARLFRWGTPAAADRLAEAVARGLRHQFTALAATPFQALAEVLNRPSAALRAVEFAPGTAMPSPAGERTLQALALGLKQRPTLDLRVSAGYDPTLDRHALAAQEIRLHVALATAGASLHLNPGPIDFSSPRDQAALEEFAEQRLAAKQRARITAPDASGSDNAAEALAYYRALFDALVANTDVSQSALTRLGRYRGRSIVGTLAKYGVDASRIRTGDGRARLDAYAGQIEVPLGLSVIQDK